MLVITTSILSKRWRYIWMAVPVLDFEYLRDTCYDDFGRECDEFSEQVLQERKNFLNFVDNVLSLNDARVLQQLRFRFSMDIDHAYAYKWINSFMQRNIQEIYLWSELYEFKLSPTFFVNDGLVVLKLPIDFKIDVPTSMNFPRLEILHLVCVSFRDDDSVARLCSNCPVLKELKLDECHDIENLHVVSSSLQRLILFHTMESCFRGEPLENIDKLIHIEAPNLEKFRLEGELTRFEISGLTSIDEAHTDINQGGFNGNAIVMELLCCVSTLKSLSFGSHFKESLGMAIVFQGTDFSGLTYLSMPAFSIFVLHGAPNLVHLGILEYFFWINPDEYQLPAPSCLSSSLRFIDVEKFHGMEEDLLCMEYVLQNALILEEIEIHLCCPNPRVERNAFNVPQEFKYLSDSSNSLKEKVWIRSLPSPNSRDEQIEEEKSVLSEVIFLCLF